MSSFKLRVSRIDFLSAGWQNKQATLQQEEPERRWKHNGCNFSWSDFLETHCCIHTHAFMHTIYAMRSSFTTWCAIIGSFHVQALVEAVYTIQRENVAFVDFFKFVCVSEGLFLDFVFLILNHFYMRHLELYHLEKCSTEKTWFDFWFGFWFDYWFYFWLNFILIWYFYSICIIIWFYLIVVFLLVWFFLFIQFNI